MPSVGVQVTASSWLTTTMRFAPLPLDQFTFICTSVTPVNDRLVAWLVGSAANVAWLPVAGVVCR